MTVTLSELPNEVLQQVLYYLPPLSLPAFQLVNRRFSLLANGLIWRHVCTSKYRYWKSDHNIGEKLAAKVEQTNWKELYTQRHVIDRHTTQTLNSILSSQTGRIEKFQQILQYGYDAKDCLLWHYSSASDAEDVLARRFYSEAILGCLHRTLAIEEWSRLRNRQSVTLERALSAFDMFVLHERYGDFDEISSKLDEYSQEIRLESTEFDSKTTRQKCLLILNYLRAHDLTGLQTEQDYRNLRNNFIGIAVNSEPHSSLPLISTAIFCSVAQRLGVDAAACSFPFHVVAMVRPPTGLTLDGTAVQKAAAPMYLDPFSSSAEIALSDLVRRLEQIRVSSALYGDYLSASSVEEIVLRTGRNIINSVQDLHQRNLTRQTLANANDWAPISSFPDLESAFYSALWASLLLGIPPDGDGPGFSMRRREFLPHIIEQFESNFPTDVSLIEAYILPLFRSTGEYAQLRESIRVTRSVDAMPKSVKRRSKEVSQRVRYRIGQVFTHKRYHYQAVITGWDMECGADELWMHRMRIHELSRGKQQSFYHVLVEDKSVRYVAEENIISMSSEPSQGLMRLAGRHLKRWDSASGCFVSNIRDEYPDD